MTGRRAVLRGAGRALGAGAGLRAVGMAAAATTSDPFDDQPGHVTLEFDESTLEAYRPLLVTRELDVRPSWLYGWVATSTERDTDVACYWAWYESQTSSLRPSAHRGDREPIYVFIDDATGDVEEVVYDAYHYLAETTTAPEIYEDDDGDHPMFRVVPDWNFYVETSEEGTFVDLADMHGAFPGWFDNDWTVHYPAVLDPWRMRTRADWWPDDVGTFSIEANFRRFWLAVGIRGAGRSDLR